MARILYPQLFEPLSQSPETVTIDRWAQPANQPTCRAAQPQQAGSFGPAAVVVSTEVITPDKWFQPSSQPTRRIVQPQQAGSIAAVSTAPETVTADRWAQPASQPTRRIIQPQQAGSFGPAAVVAAAEIVTVDKWLQPAAQPTQRRATQQPSGQAAPLSQSPETVTVDRWAQPPNQPTRRIAPTGASASSSGAIVAPTQAITWNPNDFTAGIALSNGNLTATSSGATSQGVRSTTNKTSGKWYFEVQFTTIQANVAVGIANAAEFLNAPGQLGSTGGNSMGFYPVAPTQATYANAVQLNIGASPSSSGAYIGIAVNFNTSPPTAYVTDLVMQTASTPWNNSATDNPATNTGGQSLTGLSAGPYFAAFNDATGGAVCVANFGASAFNGVIPFGYTSWDGSQTGPSLEVITLDKWFQPPAQPTRATPPRQPGGQSAPVSTAPETVTVDRWAQPISQPTRARPTQQPGALSASPAPVISGEVVTADKWLQPTAQPIRIRQVQQPSGQAAPLSQSPETVTADRWAQPANQPTRRVPTQQPTGAFAPIVTTGEIITLDKWFQPASQPTRRKGTPPPAFIFTPLSQAPEVTTMSRWFQPASQPVRRRPDFAAQAAGPVTQYTMTTHPIPTAASQRALVSWLD